MRANRGRASLALLSLVVGLSLAAAPVHADPAPPRVPTAPLAVPGKHGYLFFGQDFDVACRYRGAIAEQLRRVGALSDLIRKSGRTVVWTIAPNKSSVETRFLPRTHRMPHRRCDAKGIRAQDDALDDVTDPSYLPMRRLLEQQADAGDQMYWKDDTHWNGLSTARYTVALADGIDPALGRRQTFRRTTETITPDLSVLGVIPPRTETDPTRQSTTPVRVTWGPGQTVAGPFQMPPRTWTTTPDRRVWRGATLLLGDSFMERALGNVAPLFGSGTFGWVGVRHDRATVTALADTIVHARTVVIEVVQRILPYSVLASRAMSRALKAALRRS